VVDPPIRLLLIDDHDAFLGPLTFMLEREPDLTVVAQAGSLQEARLVLATPGVLVDVVLLDLWLPDGDGIELLREWQAAGQLLPVVVITADPDRRHQAQALAAGAAGVLSKTIDVGDLVAALRRVHAGEALYAPEAWGELMQDVALAEERARAEARLLASLTPRERQVLDALVEGLDNRAIGLRLSMSHETARTHVVKLLAKLHVDSRLQAALLAMRHGISPVPTSGRQA
jgi:DNA-binding NarL/FixJ family response regulator